MKRKFGTLGTIDGQQLHADLISTTDQQGEPPQKKTKIRTLNSSEVKTLPTMGLMTSKLSPTTKHPHPTTKTDAAFDSHSRITNQRAEQHGAHIRSSSNSSNNITKQQDQQDHQKSIKRSKRAERRRRNRNNRRIRSMSQTLNTKTEPKTKGERKTLAKQRPENIMHMAATEVEQKIMKTAHFPEFVPPQQHECTGGTPCRYILPQRIHDLREHLGLPLCMIVLEYAMDATDLAHDMLERMLETIEAMPNFSSKHKYVSMCGTSRNEKKKKLDPVMITKVYSQLFGCQLPEHIACPVDVDDYRDFDCWMCGSLVYDIRESHRPRRVVCETCYEQEDTCRNDGDDIYVPGTTDPPVVYRPQGYRVFSTMCGPHRHMFESFRSKILVCM